jgi:hypothetical protein
LYFLDRLVNATLCHFKAIIIPIRLPKFVGLGS